MTLHQSQVQELECKLEPSGYHFEVAAKQTQQTRLRNVNRGDSVSRNMACFVDSDEEEK